MGRLSLLVRGSWGVWGSNAHFVDGLVGSALGVDVQVDAVVCHLVQIVLPVQHLDGHPLEVWRPLALPLLL